MPSPSDRERLDPKAVDDLVLLSDKDMNEKGIVTNLANRFDKNKIYTYIGPVLLSVNPYKQISGLYNKRTLQAYFGRYQYEVAPHVYSTAEDTYSMLMKTGVNQCVLVSGESGAGKTEAAKKLMEYVSEVSSDFAEGNTGGRTVSEIKDSLLKSNPVLEAFGNAKTLRNDNSSRFGKYMEIQMDYNGTPLGGRITNYLLEKPRVVHQTKGERNFHIFYLLCAGMPSSDPIKSRLKLGRAEDFRILAESDSVKVKGIDDSELYYEMDEAMAAVGLDGLKSEIYGIVAAILHLGNITFTKTKKKGQDACTVDNKSALSSAASLLSVSEKALEDAITHRTRITRTDTLKSPLVSVNECDKSRDALSKALYARMFQKVVDGINDTIHTENAELSLGVLDIYGFEIFDFNSFEQLCINYCNEKLQQYFIQLTLKAEQDEYAKEGIQWKQIDYFNNQIVCDLIEMKGRKPGVMAFLDEEISLGRGTLVKGQGNDAEKQRQQDLKLLAKMNDNLGRHKHYVSLAKAKAADADPTEFVIKHYAGDVRYSVQGMIDKNMDTLFRDLLVLCGDKSKNSFINELFPEGRKKHDFKKPVTAGTQFVKDMQHLIDNLSKCEPHYIRCIKPNDNKRPGQFDDARVQHQVRYLGLMENVRVRRAGFAYRREYELFVRRYKMLSPQTWPASSGNAERDTDTILAAVGISSDGYQHGKSKLFIKEPKSLFDLEEAREKRMQYVVGIIQRTYRTWKARLYFQQVREKSVKLLHEKKRRNNSWVLYFVGDTIDATTNGFVQETLQQTRDGKVIFADYVNVHHDMGIPKKRGIISSQAFVLTSSSLLFFDTGFTSVLQRVPFQEITKVVTSQYADDFIVVNLTQTMDKKGRPVDQPSIVFDSVRKAEIITVFTEEYKMCMRTDIPMDFKNSTEITVMQKPKGAFGFMKKPVPKQASLRWSEESTLRDREALIRPWPTKKDPGYSPDQFTQHDIMVSANLGSRAQLQLDEPIPQRVLEHTAHGRKGKKKRANRRRQNW
uniref:Myosin motor domain-containing protein n=1 Tax=Aplanochytrium stocchinoi TaxID=215587 RepID=A0A7S3PQ95_9STRA|eukprot:CAMPEP_0204863952 /NCGR_PEP_ID=MMETSP1348-20121228/3697_1 /ASSEMBLY_ACC=CAM_ASM_000700 /TAXON_ID=215587 /ORGANISM="Aplanochytrium stocchinoi, Strain GSBS06" /LENGTH=1016 /DNA_ID=CAMNT_0052014423 /DNA_START=94 /DNA_END=3144 /DNA_ORIENTATION=+